MVKIRDVNLTHISNCKIYECVATTIFGCYGFEFEFAFEL